MIDELRTLDADQLRRLVGLLSDDVDVLTVDDDRIPELLVQVLRDRLAVPQRDGTWDDLGIYLRKRIVEVARDDFAFVNDTDLMTDTELATAIVDYVIRAAGRVQSNDDGPVATYFKTKSTRQRAAWVRSSAELVRATADEVIASEPATTHTGATETSASVLANLAAIGGPATLRQLGLTTRAPGSLAASPLAAAGAAMFLAGVGGASYAIIGDLADRKRRARRARRSSQVQAVIVLAAFILAEAEPVNSDLA